MPSISALPVGSEICGWLDTVRRFCPDMITRFRHGTKQVFIGSFQV